jgi:3-oxoacid CoA-transferase subunit B
VIDVTPDGLKVLELADGVGVDEIQAKTGAPLDVSAVA